MMRTHKPKTKTRTAAFACVLALILLAVMAALGVAYAAETHLNMLQSDTQAGIQCSLLQSESGLSYLTYVLREVALPAQAAGQDLVDALAIALQTRLNGTANLSGAVVTVVGTTILIPSIATDEGRFNVTINLIDDTTVHVRVAGTDGTVTRQVGLNFNRLEGASEVFDYGIASRSAVQMTGNASVSGANDATEANIFSGTYSTAESCRLTGNCAVEGDVYVANPDGYVTVTGNATIGGASGEAIQQHIHIGVGDLEFPEVDPTVFESFATNILDANTPTSGNRTFTNIRIPANRNPTFSGNITIKGVVFIEAPNTVRFTGNLNLTGVVVTEDAGEDVYTTNTIRFTGNTTVAGVESLPDTEAFAELKGLPGSFLLAPGFGVTFTGNFGAVNGCMAADAFTWTGNAGGTVRGPIINYSDSAFSLTGNAHLTIDRSTYPQTPPGFITPGRLAAAPGSYREY